MPVSDQRRRVCWPRKCAFYGGSIATSRSQQFVMSHSIVITPCSDTTADVTLLVDGQPLLRPWCKNKPAEGLSATYSPADGPGLMPDFDDEEDVEKFIKKKFRIIFDNELSAWTSNELDRSFRDKLQRSSQSRGRRGFSSARVVRPHYRPRDGQRPIGLRLGSCWASPGDDAACGHPSGCSRHHAECACPA
jgi:hypothetical protein